MFSVCFDAVDEVMDHAVADLIAKLVVVHEDVAHRLRLQQLLSPRVGEKNVKKKDSFLFLHEKTGKELSLYPWSEKKVQVFVQQNLVLRVSSTEVLEKRMCQGHDLIHLLITLWNVGTNEENEKYFRDSGNTEAQKCSRLGRFPPSRRGSAAGPTPQCGPPCFSAASAAAHDSSYWDNTAY